MARVDPTRNVRHAIRQLLPARPTVLENRRLVRFFSAIVLSLLVVLLAITVLHALAAPKVTVMWILAGWFTFLVAGAPVVFFLRARDAEIARKALGNWESDPRRKAVERLGLDLAAGRIPEQLPPPELAALEAVAADWRLVREALESIGWDDHQVGVKRAELKDLIDHAMTNLLAEAGTTSPLGPSPFLLERARSLFREVSAEAAAIHRIQAPKAELETDASLEAIRESLMQLRHARMAQEELAEDPRLAIRPDTAL